jgi:molybdopterin synthase catalytic subunit
MKWHQSFFLTLKNKFQPMITIRILSEPFDPNLEIEQLRAGNSAMGGIVSFIGLMRDMNEGEAVSRMCLEHYPGMTEKALQTIAQEVSRRWELLGCRIVHRVDELAPMDTIVLVAVASARRMEAFRACEFIIDYIKTRAPFWKKEFTPKGPRWVAGRQLDSVAEHKWRD